MEELAAARAEVIRNYLVSKAGLPKERVQFRQSSACGAQADLLPVPVW